MDQLPSDVVYRLNDIFWEKEAVTAYRETSRVEDIRMEIIDETEFVVWERVGAICNYEKVESLANL